MLRKVGAALRYPPVFWKTFFYICRVMSRQPRPAYTLWRALRGRVRGINLVLHNFMSAEEMAGPREERVQKRLAACSFRGAVRRGGEWQAVPMCEMNTAYRSDLYAAQVAADPAEAEPATRRA